MKAQEVGYKITGFKSNVSQLIADIKDKANNPKSYFSIIPSPGPLITPMIPAITAYLRSNYPQNDDLLEITMQGANIKVVGFKNKEIQLRLTKLIEKIK